MSLSKEHGARIVTGVKYAVGRPQPRGKVDLSHVDQAIRRLAASVIEAAVQDALELSPTTRQDRESAVEFLSGGVMLDFWAELAGASATTITQTWARAQVRKRRVYGEAAEEAEEACAAVSGQGQGGAGESA